MDHHTRTVRRLPVARLGSLPIARHQPTSSLVGGRTSIGRRVLGRVWRPHAIGQRISAARQCDPDPKRLRLSRLQSSPNKSPPQLPPSRSQSLLVNSFTSRSIQHRHNVCPRLLRHCQAGQRCMRSRPSIPWELWPLCPEELREAGALAEHRRSSASRPERTMADLWTRLSRLYSSSTRISTTSPPPPLSSRTPLPMALPSR